MTKEIEEELINRTKRDMCIIKYSHSGHYFQCHYCGRQNGEARYLSHDTSCFGKRLLFDMEPKEPKNILDQWLNNEIK